MTYLALGILVLSIGIAFLAVITTANGLWVMVLGAVLAGALTDFSVLGWSDVVVLAVAYLIGEVFEWVGAALGAKGFGASKRAALGAVAGGILGALLGSLAFGIGLFLGSLLGVCAGAAIVEWWYSKDLQRAMMAGVGGLVGRVGVVFVKVLLALMMSAYLLVQIWSNWRGP